MGQTVNLPDAAPRFLAAEGWEGADISEFSADAAFRRYFRLRKGDRSAILMHAPDPSERSEWFVELALEIRRRGMSGPAIHAYDLSVGLILLEDLGTHQYFQYLKTASQAAERELYLMATDVLVALHADPMPARLGDVIIDDYGTERMIKEAELLLDWHWPELMEGSASDDVRSSYRAVWQAVLPAGLYDADRMVQLDYHAPNLMWLPEREGPRRVGILDFQDAMRGPSAYDLVSLLQDARRDVPQDVQMEMLARYLAGRDVDEAAFRTSYAVMGAQRAARILGVFVRLWRRDAKPGYLNHLPRLWGQLDQNLSQAGLEPLADWFGNHLPASVRRTFKDHK
ncbi:phosphotransferase [Pacificimonas sp. WHA3]|uniref:Phosphotransferase n=1 Tax=Pacificimonas pallii TaxID=2827236 RepID=A0ABS6SAQ9_9SPHN|nr:phosphotransferase [Pacificimonas pallii]MBV7255489.1 phosphotransferase [Pacificimonas pallii]